jgi:hypothetical protein
VNPDAAREPAKRLERLDEFLVRDAVQIYLCAGLAGEEPGELDVEVDEVLGVLSPLELVLRCRV